MDQDIEQDPAPWCSENQGNNHLNLDTHVERRGGLNLGLGLQASTGEGSEADHSLEEGANTIKTGVS